MEPNTTQLLEFEDCGPRLLENNVEVSKDRWDDPGDYPSGAGGGPMASYDYYIIEGNFVVAFTEQQLNSLAVHMKFRKKYPNLDFDKVVAVFGPIDWYKEVIAEFISSPILLKFGSIKETGTRYLGDGKFEVTILDYQY